MSINYAGRFPDRFLFIHRGNGLAPSPRLPDRRTWQIGETLERVFALWTDRVRARQPGDEGGGRAEGGVGATEKEKRKEEAEWKELRGPSKLLSRQV